MRATGRGNRIIGGQERASLKRIHLLRHSAHDMIQESGSAHAAHRRAMGAGVFTKALPAVLHEGLEYQTPMASPHGTRRSDDSYLEDSDPEDSDPEDSDPEDSDPEDSDPGRG
jgi:hypothetical protein